MKLWIFNARDALKTIAAAALLALWAFGPIVSFAATLPTGAFAAESIVNPQGPGGGADPAAAESLPSQQSGSLLTGARAVGSLMFILALILLTMVLFKRYMPDRFGPLGHKRRIQILETVAMGEKRSLTLVEIDGSSLLLASTPNSVSLLKEFHSGLSIAPDTHATKPEQTAASQAKVEMAGDDSVTIESPVALQHFEETLAAEVLKEAAARRPSLLSRISRIRAELEAR